MTQALAAHFTQDSLLPRAPDGLRAGAVLAVLVHAALLVALSLATQWRTRTPEVVSAELWAAVPLAAAPAPPPAVVAPPPPPPPPVEVAPRPAAKPAPAAPPAAPQQTQRDADIATEQALKIQEAKEAAAALKQREADLQRKAELAAQEKVKAEKAKLEKNKAAEAEKKAQAERLKAEQAEKAEKAEKAAKAEKAEKAAKAEKAEKEAERKAALAKEKAEQKAEETRLVQQREENLRRIMGQAGPTPAQAGTGGSGTAAQASAPSATYVGRLVALIRPNIVFTGQVSGNPAAEVEVRAAAGGAIISRELVKSSGSKEWDEAVLRAIDRTAALPRDTDGRVPPALILVFRPNF